MQIHGDQGSANLSLVNAPARTRAATCKNAGMTNIAAVLKSEITRLARKEIRAEIAALRKASSQQRASMAALRREVEQLRRQQRSAGKSRAPQTSAQPSAEDDSVQRRFRPAGLAAHRKKLGLSAADYGALVGVSGQSIHHWEAGQRPRAKQLEALAVVRGIGKREAAQRLAMLQQAPQAPKPRATAKAGAKAGAKPKARAKPKAGAKAKAHVQTQAQAKGRSARARA
jgi:DNA-binding transcriptional regulator YiaG